MHNTDGIKLPDAPPLPGLSFSRLRDTADYVGMATVHENSRTWDKVDPLSARESVPTADDLAQTFPIADVRDNPDMLLVRVDGQIVGYNHVLWRWTEETGTRVYLHLGYLEPPWRGKGIGSAILDWAQRRIREIAAQEQAIGARMFATNVSSTEHEAGKLMRDEGYVVVRQLSDMVRDSAQSIAVPELPPGIVLHPLVPEHYSAVYRAWKDAFAGIWTSTPESEEDYRAFVAEKAEFAGFDPALCQVAWADDQVVGFVWCRIQKNVGTIPEVAVRKAWQRQGVARALMARALMALHEQSVEQVRLFTDAADGQGARSLYESLGFREVKQHFFYRKPL